MKSTTIVDEQISDALLSQYADLIYSVAGITISPQKKVLLSNRLRRRLKATGIESFEAYYRHLKKLSASEPEWDEFLQVVTTHETYLFRDERHWTWLSEEYLPAVRTECASGKRSRELRLWSAACSTGDEAYSMASCIADGLIDRDRWSISIVGTDIGTGAVEEARNAVFNERAMRLVPERMKTRFFTKARDAEVWTAKPELSKWVQFKQHNLLDRLPDAPFDVVYLKNVLIYFDAGSKQKVVDHVRSKIKPGGYLVTGGAEGISSMLKDMDSIHPWLHRA